MLAYIRSHLTDDRVVWGTLLGWLFTHPLGDLAGGTDGRQQSRSWVDEWLLGKILVGTLQDFGLDDQAASRAVNLIKALVSHGEWFDTQRPQKTQAPRVLETWLKDDAVQHFLRVNRHQGVLWFNREAFDELLWWMILTAAVDQLAAAKLAPEALAGALAGPYTVVRQLQSAAKRSRYQVQNLLAAASE